MPERHVATRLVAHHRIGRRNGQADRPVVFGEIERIHRRRRRGLGQAVRFDQRHAGHLLPALGNSALHGHPAAQGHLQCRKIELGEIRIVDERIEQRVDAGERRELVARHLLHEARNVARIGDQHVLGAERHEDEAVRSQRKDVIERQRRENHVPLVAQERLHPGAGLQQIGDDVPVQQHRPLRNAGRAAGVLQERDVLVRDGHMLELAPAAFGQRFGQPHRARETPRRDQFLDVAQHEVDQQALPAEELADAGHDDLLDRCLADDFLHGVREVLDDDDHLGAAVDQLMLELARRVQRVGIHHRIARPQNTEQAHWVLQNVGHHQGDARALLEAASLEKRAERGGSGIELSKADRMSHAGVGWPRTELLDDPIEYVAYRRVRVDVDLGVDAFRIRLEPDPVHSPLPGGLFRSCVYGFGPMLGAPSIFGDSESGVHRRSAPPPRSLPGLLSRMRRRRFGRQS